MLQQRLNVFLGDACGSSICNEGVPRMMTFTANELVGLERAIMDVPEQVAPQPCLPGRSVMPPSLLGITSDLSRHVPA